jgi:hypothetical protein
MPRANPSPRFAITAESGVHAAAESVSVSAGLTGAAVRAVTLADGLAAVAEWEADNGALTAGELEEARKRAAQRG